MILGSRIFAVFAACLLWAGQWAYAQDPQAQVTNIERIRVSPGTDHLEMLNWEIMLNFRIEGRLVRFLVDTAAARSSVSTEIGKDLVDGKTYAIQRMAYSGGPDVITQRTRDVAVELPGMTCTTSFDVDDVAGQMIQVDGRLGRDVLSHFMVTIDYGTQTIKFAKPGLDAPPSAPLATGTLYGFGAFIPLSITDDNGVVHEGEGLVDTAINMPLVLWDQSVAIRATGSTRHIGLAGGANSQTGFAPKLTYGGIERKYVQVVAGAWKKEIMDQLVSLKFVPKDALGDIGVSVLPNFKLTLDFYNGKIYFEPAIVATPDITSDDEPPQPYPNSEENKKWHDLFVSWWKVATKKNDAGAAGVVAMSYGYGHGVTQDYGMMLSWARRAADQNDARGQSLVGMANMYGYAGLKSDLAVGRSWYEKSAAQGFAEAEYMMGICNEHGLGGPQDLTAALDWFQKAAAGTSEAVQQNDRTAHNLREIQQAIARTQAELAAAPTSAVPAAALAPAPVGAMPSAQTNQSPAKPDATH